MAGKISKQCREIELILSESVAGMSRGQIKSHLSFPVEDKTLQRRLSALVAVGRIRKEGEKRTTRYFALKKRMRVMAGI